MYTRDFLSSFGKAGQGRLCMMPCRLMEADAAIDWMLSMTQWVAVPHRLDT